MKATLQQLQSAMQQTILTGPADVAEPHFTQRLSIYATAYRARLGEALAHNYPALQTHLGVESFMHLADRYRHAHPSTHVSVRVFGAQLADWLTAERPYAPWLAEFAQFEWTLANAFDAVDEPSVAIDALARIEPNSWPQLAFCFARNVGRLTLHTNAVELYACAARDQPSSAAAIAKSPSEWLIWRQALTAQYRSMTRLEACALDALRAGQTFGEACERIVELGEETAAPLQAAACLKRWISDGLISAVTIRA